MKKIIALILLVALALIIYWLTKSQNTPDHEPLLPPQQAKVTEQDSSKSKVSAHAASSLIPRQGPAEIDFDEDPKGNIRLEGQVLDDQNLPVGMAWVSIDTRPPKKTTTDKGGSFVFEGLLSRRYSLQARKDSQVGGPLAYLLTESSDPAIIHLRLGAVLEIRTVRQKDGEPVSGAKIELRGTENRQSFTDTQGLARFVGVPGGFITIVAQAQGFAPRTKLMSVPDPAGRQAIKLTMKLQNGLSVQGTVVDEQGDPIYKARVMAINTAKLFDPKNEDRGGVVSDEKGQFTFQALERGSYRLLAIHPKHPRARSRIFDLRHKPVTGIKITMATGGKISGVVLSKDGAPAPWASIRIGPQDYSIGTRLTNSMISRGAFSDKQGRFHFEGLPRKKLIMVARGKGASSKSKSVDLESRSIIDDITLVLDVEGSISGTVRTSRGEPVPEVEVIATPDIWEEGIGKDLHLRNRAYAMTNGGGEFILSGLNEGTYRLHASKSRGASERMFRPGVRAKTGDKNVELILDAGGGIKGELVFDDGSVPDSFSVAVGFSAGIPFSGSSGAFEVKQVPPGVFSVSIRGESFAETTIPDVKVEPEKISDLGTIRLTRGRTLIGVVFEENGDVVAGAKVTIATRLIGDGSNISTDLGNSFTENNDQRQTISEQDGSFRITGIPYKKLVIVAEHEKLGRAIPLVIDAETPSPYVELVIKGLGSLFGKVTSNAKPVSGAIISATSASGGAQALVVHTEQDGTYHLDKISAGLHMVTASVLSSSGFGARTQSGEIDVRPGEQNRLDLDIPVGHVELTVQIIGINGAAISAAQVFLLPGKVEISNSGQLEKIASSGGIMMSFWMPARAAVFQKIIPGDYSLCVIPISGNMNDLAFLQKLQKHRSELLVHCEYLSIESSPEKQSSTVSTPPMPPLDSAPEQKPQVQATEPRPMNAK